MKDPTERFLMTLPKPIYEWLSNQAEKTGISIQDLLRHILARQKKLSELEEGNYSDSEEHKTLKEKCYELGKKIYDEFAVERKRLCVKQIAGDGGVIWVPKEKQEESILIPVIQTSFQPYISKTTISVHGTDSMETELDKLDICKAAQKLAETENRLLSICEDGDIVYEAMPFRCSVWFRNRRWEGVFRVCVNSERTPSITDAFKQAYKTQP